MEIYLVTNSCNGKIYVGQTLYGTEERWITHKRDAKYGYSKMVLHKAIKKYSESSFLVEKLCVCTSQEELNRAEKFLIWITGSHKSSFGYNSRLGGNGSSHNELTKERIKTNTLAGQAKMTKADWDRRNQNISETMTGRVYSVDRRLAQSLAHTGRPRTELELAYDKRKSDILSKPHFSAKQFACDEAKRGKAKPEGFGAAISLKLKLAWQQGRVQRKTDEELSIVRSEAMRRSWVTRKNNKLEKKVS